MPDEIMPRDRAELLWNAIINHTIEAVDAIRDRPELIAAAIAAGLPDMLGDPRDRYEMFLKAIAGAQGGGGSETHMFDINNIDESSDAWNTPLFPAFSAGHTFTADFKPPVIRSNSVLLAIGQRNNLHTPNNINTLHIHIIPDSDDVDKMTIRIYGEGTAHDFPGYAWTENHVITINSVIKIDGVQVMNTPTRVYNGTGGSGRIMFGNFESPVFTGHINTINYA